MQAGNARPGLSARLIVGPAHRTPSVAPGQGGAGWLAARLASHPGRVRVTGPRKPGRLPPVATLPRSTQLQVEFGRGCTAAYAHSRYDHTSVMYDLGRALRVSPGSLIVPAVPYYST
jgi:hypothetical protein